MEHTLCSTVSRGCAVPCLCCAPIATRIFRCKEHYADLSSVLCPPVHYEGHYWRRCVLADFVLVIRTKFRTKAEVCARKKVLLQACIHLIVATPPINHTVTFIGDLPAYAQLTEVLARQILREDAMERPLVPCIHVDNVPFFQKGNIVGRFLAGPLPSEVIRSNVLLTGAQAPRTRP